MGADTNPVVELEDVHKTYAGRGGTPAVAGVSLAIAHGAFVSLVGPSGSGKTTLLNVIAGLDTPDRGRVRIGGRDLGQMTDSERSYLRLHNIGFVFQAFNLVPSLSVYENVTWPLEFAGLRGADVRERAMAVLDRVGAAGVASRSPSELSGGEQQRVAIARAIATRPWLILADEPTGNLDSHTGRVILDLLRELNHDEGVTILMVTHNMFAASYGDRTLELRDGRIVRDVTPPHDVAVGWKGD